MLIPKCLVWNCRGASSFNALHHLSLIIKINSPDILIRGETRCSSLAIDKIMNRSYFDKTIITEAVDFSGGIWLIWDDTQVGVQEMVIYEQILNVVIRFRN